MMLTDREWLRFVSSALAVGFVLGAVYTGALVTYGRGPLGAMVGALLGAAAIVPLFHLGARRLLDRAQTPQPDSSEEAETA